MSINEKEIKEEKRKRILRETESADGFHAGSEYSSGADNVVMVYQFFMVSVFMGREPCV